MKRNLRLLFAAGCAALLSTGSAQAQKKMVVTPHQGEAWEVALGSLNNFTFANGNLQVGGLNGPLQTFKLAEIQSITFAAGFPTGIDRVTDNAAAVQLHVGNDRVSVTGINEATPLTLYSISGQRVASKQGAASEGISTKSLPQGVYLLRAGKHTFKFSK